MENLLGEIAAAELNGETKLPSTKPSEEKSSETEKPSKEKSSEMEKPSAKLSPGETSNGGKPPLSLRERLAFLDNDDPFNYTFGLANDIISNLGLASLFYAMLAPWLLWHVADQPPALIWTSSLLACCYLFLWIISLSETLGVITAFFCTSYIALFAVAHLIDPVNSIAIMYLNTFYVAKMLRYAVAKYTMGPSSLLAPWSCLP